jgi:hypothetical protein
LMKTATGLWLLLQIAKSVHQLPKRIIREPNTFENALATTQMTDLRSLAAWLAYRRVSICDSQRRPRPRPHRDLRYRLHVRIGTIDLVRPLPQHESTSFLKPKQQSQVRICCEKSCRIEMFSRWKCLGCDLAQERRLDAGQICARCNFRNEVENPTLAKTNETDISGDETLPRSDNPNSPNDDLRRRRTRDTDRADVKNAAFEAWLAPEPPWKPSWLEGETDCASAASYPLEIDLEGLEYPDKPMPVVSTESQCVVWSRKWEEISRRRTNLDHKQGAAGEGR